LRKALAGEGARVSSVRAMWQSSSGGGGDWRRRYSRRRFAADEVKRVVAEAIAAWAVSIASLPNAGGPRPRPFEKARRWRLGYRVSAST